MAISRALKNRRVVSGETDVRPVFRRAHRVDVLQEDA
jgi:hypothetical protein